MRQGRDAWNSGDAKAASTNYALALIESEKFATNSTKRITTMESLATVRMALRQYAEAESLYLRRLDVGRSLGWTNTVDYMLAMESLADTQSYLKKYAEAEQTYSRAESIMEFKYKYGRMDYRFGMLLSRHAGLYLMEGKYNEADSTYEEARVLLAQIENAVDPTSFAHGVIMVEMGNLYNDIGLLKKKQKKYAEAEKSLGKSMSYIENQYGRESSNLVTPLNNLASTFALEDKFADAEKAIRRSMAIINKKDMAKTPMGLDTQELLKIISERRKPRE